MPTYRFRTTSAYISASGASEPYNPMSGSNERRAVKSSWDDPGEEDDPSGVVPDPAPLGDAPWWMMFLLATAYSAFRYRKKSLT